MDTGAARTIASPQDAPAILEKMLSQLKEKDTPRETVQQSKVDFFQHSVSHKNSFFNQSEEPDLSTASEQSGSTNRSVSTSPQTESSLKNIKDDEKDPPKEAASKPNKLITLFAIVISALILSTAALFIHLTNEKQQSLAVHARKAQLADLAKKIPEILQGNFDYSYTNMNGERGYGSITLVQTDHFITGTGFDYDGKQNRKFKLDGVYNAPRLTVQKRYLRGSQTSGNPITYSGLARFNEAHDIVLNGSWHFDGKSAALSDALNQSWSAITQHPVETSARRTDSIFWSLVQLLAVCISFGMTLVFISLKFFGMHGLLNSWERRKYIPSSSMQQHLKLMKELGKGQQRGSLRLGERLDWNLQRFYLPKTLFMPASRRQRHPHLLVLGGASKGKSRFLAQMIVDDIKNNDRAVVVLDSEGSTVEQVLRWLCSAPEAAKYHDRIRLIDPTLSDAASYNPLMLCRKEALQSAANSVVMAFKAVCTESQNQQNQWTEQTAGILRNALVLLILNKCNLAELPKLLSDNDFRDVLLNKVEQMGEEWKPLIEAWYTYKKQARSEQWLSLIDPILNRVQPLLSDARISRLLNSRENSIDLEDIIERKNVLLVRVPEGQLEKAGNLLGSLILGGVRQAGLNQFEQTREAAGACSVYMDKLNNFMGSDAFEFICADFRKINIEIHATLKSLQDISEDYRNRVLVNFGAMALFSMSKKDADTFGPAMFKVDGRKVRKVNFKDVFNPINSQPTMDLASDEEKINVNRLVGLPERCYFLHLVGEEGGVFNLKAPEFNDIARGDLNLDLMESLLEQNEEDDEEDE